MKKFTFLLIATTRKFNKLKQRLSVQMLQKS